LPLRMERRKGLEPNISRPRADTADTGGGGG
jgi:hypothetical protein